MFGDNKYVVDSAIYPYSKIHKRHTVLSFHHFREAIEYKMVTFYRVSGGYNLADILSNNSSYNNIWVIMQPLIFGMRDTMDFLYLELKGGGGQEKGE